MTMFGLFRRKNPYEQEALSIYAGCLEQVRKPIFYEDMGVPDTMDGRFDLLLLHVFIATHGRDPDLGQALFDVMFHDMDQMLREIGIGDMGVPKHMKRMMKGFNGRMQAYAGAGDDLSAAIERNVYGTVEAEDLNAEHVRGLSDYAHKALKSVKKEGLAR